MQQVAQQVGQQQSPTQVQGQLRGGGGRLVGYVEQQPVGYQQPRIVGYQPVQVRSMFVRLREEKNLLQYHIL